MCVWGGGGGGGVGSNVVNNKHCTAKIKLYVIIGHAYDSWRKDHFLQNAKTRQSIPSRQ